MNQGGLKVIYLEATIVVMQEFDNKFIFIAISDIVSEVELKHLINMAINTIVIAIGMNSIKSYQNIDNLKRDLKLCYYIIEKLLNEIPFTLFERYEKQESFASTELLEKLNIFCEEINTPYGSIHCNHKTFAATDGWSDLDIVERKLLDLMIESSSFGNCDLPVFLPKKSPYVKNF